MESLVIGVSGINAVDNPGPGVGVARSLKEATDFKAHIVGLSYDAMEPGIYMDWVVDQAFLMPYPSSGHDAFIERLLYIKQRTGLNVIIPTLDTELPLYIKYQNELKSHGILTLLPTLDQFKLRSKDQLVAVAKNIGISIPKTRVISSLDELAPAIEEIGYPVMVKGAFYKAERAYNYHQAIEKFNYITAEWGYPVILQEIVTGEEMNVVAVGDGAGGSLGMVGIKKLWVTSLGKIWTGVTIQNEGMRQATQSFLEKYRWCSAFELECLVQDDEIFLIEINPRFPAWSYFATGVGVNLPANLVRHLCQLPIPPIADYDSGKLYVRYTYEMVTDMKAFQQITTQGER